MSAKDQFFVDPCLEGMVRLYYKIIGDKEGHTTIGRYKNIVQVKSTEILTDNINRVREVSGCIPMECEG